MLVCGWMATNRRDWYAPSPFSPPIGIGSFGRGVMPVFVGTGLVDDSGMSVLKTTVDGNQKSGKLTS